MDLFSFNFIIDVSSASRMRMQSQTPGVVRQTTLFTTNGNAIDLLHLSKAALDVLFERQLVCFFKDSKVDGFVALHG